MHPNKKDNLSLAWKLDAKVDQKMDQVDWFFKAAFVICGKQFQPHSNQPKNDATSQTIWIADCFPLNHLQMFQQLWPTDTNAFRRSCMSSVANEDASLLFWGESFCWKISQGNVNEQVLLGLQKNEKKRSWTWGVSHKSQAILFSGQICFSPLFFHSVCCTGSALSRCMKISCHAANLQTKDWNSDSFDSNHQFQFDKSGTVSCFFLVLNWKWMCPWQPRGTALLQPFCFNMAIILVIQFFVHLILSFSHLHDSSVSIFFSSLLLLSIGLQVEINKLQQFISPDSGQAPVHVTTLVLARSSQAMTACVTFSNQCLHVSANPGKHKVFHCDFFENASCKASHVIKCADSSLSS